MANNSISSETYKLIKVVPVYYQYSDNKGIAIFEDITALSRCDVYQSASVTSQKVLIVINAFVV
jgi:hypothetical protein